MSRHTVENCIDWIFSNTPEGSEFIEIGFIGGEPLLEYDLLRHAYEYTNNKYQGGTPFLFFATTNGTCLSEEQKKWFSDKTESFALTLSIDGMPETHNFNRCNSFELIDIDYFARHYGSHAVKMTISEHSLYHLADNIKYIHELGFKRIAGVNLFEGDFDWAKPEYETVLISQLRALVDYYLSHPELPLNQMLDVRLDRCEFAKGVMKKRCGIGVESVFFDTDGKRYPCPFVTPMTFAKEDLIEVSKTEFTNAQNFTDAECFSSCYLYPACPTCAGANYLTNRCLAQRDRRRCRLLKLVSLFAAEIQARRIVAGVDGMDERRKFYTIQAIKKIKTEISPEFHKLLS